MTCFPPHYCRQIVGRTKRCRCRRLAGRHIQAELRLRGFAPMPSKSPYGEISMVNNARLFLGVPQVMVGLEGRSQPRFRPIVPDTTARLC